MARRTKKRKRSYRGRRVGAIRGKAQTEETLMLLAGAVAGAVGQRIINNALAKFQAQNPDSFLKNLPPVVLSGVEALAGGAIVWYAGNTFVKGLGIGMVGGAGLGVLQDVGVLSGVGNIYRSMVPYRPNPLLNGTSVTPAVGAANKYGFPQVDQVGRVPMYRAAGAQSA